MIKTSSKQQIMQVIRNQGGIISILGNFQILLIIMTGSLSNRLRKQMLKEDDSYVNGQQSTARHSESKTELVY